MSTIQALASITLDSIETQSDQVVRKNCRTLFGAGHSGETAR